MSDYQYEGDQRECRRCGALLSMWDCDACGSDSFETVADTYITELAASWRHGAGLAGDRRAVDAALAF